MFSVYIMLKDYNIVKLLGAGGQGKVFLGTRISDGKKVVVKDVPLTDEKTISAFESESAILNVLYKDNACSAHNVLCIIEYFIENNHGYIITDYYENSMDLFEYVNEQHNVLSSFQFLDLCLQMLTAVKYIHDNNILHMDIKSENILVIPSRVNKSANLKAILLDFGLSCPKDQCELRGTPNFMAPELFIKSHPITEAADIFSLGITLFTVASGNYPYNDVAVEKWMKEKPPTLGTYPTFNFGYRKYIQKYPFLGAMINPNPEKRKNVDELIEIVQQASRPAF